jgi:hypothetical protein
MKLAIKDQVGPFTLLKDLNYESLKSVIANSLKDRLIELQVNDYNTLVETLLTELSRNQSILTMSKV